MEPAISDAIIDYICGHTEPSWCLRVVALVCRRWAASVAAMLPWLIRRGIAASFVQVATRNLQEIAPYDTLIEPGEHALFTSPLLTVTLNKGCRWPRGMSERQWFVAVCKFDPDAQIFIRMIIAPQSIKHVHNYIARGLPRRVYNAYVQIATQQYHMRAAIVMVDVNEPQYTWLDLRLATSADSDSYDRVPTYCAGSVGCSKYVLANISQLIDLMGEPTVDIGRHLPGLGVLAPEPPWVLAPLCSASTRLTE